MIKVYLLYIACFIACFYRLFFSSDKQENAEKICENVMSQLEKYKN